MPLRLRELVIDPPLLNASGAFDVVAADPDWSQTTESASPLGAYVSKTVTLQARRGNPQPWVALWNGDESLVNSVGLANPGIDGALEQWRDLPDQLDCAFVLSLGGSALELAQMVDAAERAGWCDAYELNLSCPNTGARALQAGDPELVFEAVAAVRARTQRPVIAKLSAACSDIAASALAAQRAGADAIAAINTMPVRALDDQCKPLLGSLDGGMSGADLHPVALRCVAHVSREVDIPVIGIGGVRSIASMQRMFACGAQAVGVGTAAAMAPSVLRELASAISPAPVA